MAKTGLVPASENLLLMQREQIRAMVRHLPVGERAPFSRRAKAACQYLRAAKEDYGKAYTIACAMMENWRLLGLELPELIKAGRPKKKPGNFNGLTLGGLGVDENESKRCQKMAQISEKEFTEWLDSLRNEPRYQLPSLFMTANSVHVSHNSGEHEWYTPGDYIEAAKQVLGEIDLDPASSAKAQEMVGARTWYDESEDGLEKDWSGRVWLNPPYTSGVIDSFMAKLRESFDAGAVTAAISLTNNATDTDWFSGAAESASAICLVAKRVKFLDADGNPGAPLQGQVCLYFGYRPEAFVDSFAVFGGMWVKP